MKDLLDRYLFLIPRRPDDGGGSGGGGNGGDGGGQQGSGEDDAAGAGAQEGGSAGASADPPAGDDFKLPDFLPEHLRGADAGETVEKLAAEWKKGRDKAAASDVPESPDAYREFDVEAAPEGVREHLQALGQDPLFEAVAKVAHEEGVGRGTLQKLTTALYTQAQEAGILEPMLDPAAERAAMLPESHKSAAKAEQDKAIDAYMQENFDFVDLMAANRGLSKEAAEYAQMMLGDSAKGHAFMSWLRGQFAGGQAGPGAHGQGGGQRETAETLKADLAAMEKKRGGPDWDPKAYAELEERYRKFHSGN